MSFGGIHGGGWILLGFVGISLAIWGTFGAALWLLFF